MTIDQTRQLGIEFERRLNTIDPTTVLLGKLDTQTIYSFLNEYQNKYIQTMYLADDQVEANTKTLNKTQDIIKTLVVTTTLTDYNKNTLGENTKGFKLPENYLNYIRSSSVITKSYKGDYEQDQYVPNIMCKQSEAYKVIPTHYDHKILINPYVVLHSVEINSETSKSYQEYLTIIHDEYTNVKKVDLVYCRRPNEFSILDNKACELPYQCFDDIVTGAVQLYLTYRTGAKNQENTKQKQKDE